MGNYDIAKRNYDRGLWTNDMISKLVEKGKLTAEEYLEITGEPFAGGEAEPTFDERVKRLEAESTATQVALTEVYEMMLGGGM